MQVHADAPCQHDVFVSVTRRKQQRPGIASNDNTMHVPTATSSSALTKPNHTPMRPTRATDQKKRTDRTSRQTQVGIGHSAPAHRGRQVQNRIRHRQVRWGKKSNTVWRQSNHARKEDQAGREKRAKIIVTIGTPLAASSHRTHVSRTQGHGHTVVQWSEDVIKADPFFGRSRVRFRVPPWVSNTIARDHLA